MTEVTGNDFTTLSSEENTGKKTRKRKRTMISKVYFETSQIIMKFLVWVNYANVLS